MSRAMIDEQRADQDGRQRAQTDGAHALAQSQHADQGNQSQAQPFPESIGHAHRQPLYGQGKTIIG